MKCCVGGASVANLAFRERMHRFDRDAGVYESNDLPVLGSIFLAIHLSSMPLRRVKFPSSPLRLLRLSSLSLLLPPNRLSNPPRNPLPLALNLHSRRLQIAQNSLPQRCLLLALSCLGMLGLEFPRSFCALLFELWLPGCEGGRDAAEGYQAEAEDGVKSAHF